MLEISKLYPLHNCVFKNDVDLLKDLLDKHDVAEKDKHGNTALHLSAMLGRKDCVKVLLEKNASVELLNLAGWSALDEAVCYGDRELVTWLVEKKKLQSLERIEKNKQEVLDAIKEMGNFYAELKWELETAVPVVSTFLPRYKCRIHKKDTMVRIDVSQYDCSEIQCEGEKSYILDISPGTSTLIIELNNKTKTWKSTLFEDLDDKTEKIVDRLFKNQLVLHPSLRIPLRFKRLKDETEDVAKVDGVESYKFNNVSLICVTRWEHLYKVAFKQDSADETPNSTENPQTSSTEQSSPSAENTENPDNNQANPRPECDILWESYINAPEGKHPSLGKQKILKKDMLSLTGKVTMCDRFPIQFPKLMKVLQVNELDFLNMPPGFPVKIELCITSFMTARISVLHFNNMKTEFPDSLFDVPAGYKEF